MVKYITKEGFIYFLQLGGWFDQVLLGQRVVIKTGQGDVVGVIGAKPIHLQPADQRDKVVKKQDMYIDIGASSQEEVEAAGVRPGDPVIPAPISSRWLMVKLIFPRPSMTGLALR